MEHFSYYQLNTELYGIGTDCITWTKAPSSAKKKSVATDNAISLNQEIWVSAALTPPTMDILYTVSALWVTVNLVPISKFISIDPVLTDIY